MSPFCFAGETKITMFKEITIIFHRKTRPPTASFTICSIEIKGTSNKVKKGLKSCRQKLIQNICEHLSDNAESKAVCKAMIS